jgi:hypothetical protein
MAKRGNGVGKAAMNLLGLFIIYLHFGSFLKIPYVIIPQKAKKQKR